MPYEEAFADLLTNRGVPLSADAVPSKEAVDADLKRLARWLESLEPDTHLAMDEITGENAIQAGLADPSVGIVKTIGSILEAFDSQPESISISTVLEMLSEISAAAADIA